MTKNRNTVYFKGKKAEATPESLKRQIRKAMWLLGEFPGYKERTCSPYLLNIGTKLHCAFNDIRDLESELKGN